MYVHQHVTKDSYSRHVCWFEAIILCRVKLQVVRSIGAKPLKDEDGFTEDADAILDI